MFDGQSFEEMCELDIAITKRASRLALDLGSRSPATVIAWSVRDKVAKATIDMATSWMLERNGNPR